MLLFKTFNYLKINAVFLILREKNTHCMYSFKFTLSFIFSVDYYDYFFRIILILNIIYKSTRYEKELVSFGKYVFLLIDNVLMSITSGIIMFTIQNI